jgi:hypothetical protein
VLKIVGFDVYVGLKGIVAGPARGQAVKGIFTAGFTKAGRYAKEKLTKQMNSKSP